MDVDVLASRKRELRLWVLIGALEWVVAVEGGAEEKGDSDLHPASTSRLLSPTVPGLWTLGGPSVAK